MRNEVRVNNSNILTLVKSFNFSLFERAFLQPKISLYKGKSKGEEPKVTVAGELSLHQ